MIVQIPVFSGKWMEAGFHTRLSTVNAFNKGFLSQSTGQYRPDRNPKKWDCWAISRLFRGKIWTDGLRRAHSNSNKFNVERTYCLSVEKATNKWNPKNLDGSKLAISHFVLILQLRPWFHFTRWQTNCYFADCGHALLNKSKSSDQPLLGKYQSAILTLNLRKLSTLAQIK